MGATDMAQTKAAELVSTATGWIALRRFAADFTLALVAFAALAGLFSIGASNAFPALPPPELSLAQAAWTQQPAMIVATPVFASTADGPTHTQTLLLLACAFATLVAANLAIGRHLISAYVAPLRKRARGD